MIDPAFLLRLKPISRNAEPPCMNITSTAATMTQTESSPTPMSSPLLDSATSWVDPSASARDGIANTTTSPSVSAGDNLLLRIDPPRGETEDQSVVGWAQRRCPLGRNLRGSVSPLGRTAILPPVTERNVLGSELEPCGTEPMTGFYRDGCCHTGPEDLGSHTICAVVTAEFLEHQRSIGNDLSTAVPQYAFPGLEPGDRWCVTAANWLRAHQDGAAALVVLASTHERALEIVPFEALAEHAVDVPDDATALE